jgi:hypothetical protein
MHDRRIAKVMQVYVFAKLPTGGGMAEPILEFWVLCRETTISGLQKETRVMDTHLTIADVVLEVLRRRVVVYGSHGGLCSCQGVRKCRVKRCGRCR